MSEQSSSEATEPASEKALADARLRGEVAKSREVVSASVLLCGGAALFWGVPLAIAYWEGLFVATVSLMPREHAVAGALVLGQRTLLLLTLPVVVAAALGALVANYAQVGALVTLKPVTPQLARFDPMRQLKQIWGSQLWVTLLRAALLVTVAGFLVGATLWAYRADLLALAGQRPAVMVSAVAEVGATLAWRALGLTVVVASVDLFYQRYRFAKRMRMTHQQVKREQKESDGDPQLKADRQRVHRELAESRMYDEIATADVVIVNPEHLAVALRYDKDGEAAPKVVAKGRRLQAAKIRQLARSKGVPIVRNVPLARSLIDLELDEEIPEDLYAAVAEILRWIYTVAAAE